MLLRHDKIIIYIRILLTCALKAHNNILFLEKILLGIEKILTTFSISDKFFSKTNLLTCALLLRIEKVLIVFSIFDKFFSKMNLLTCALRAHVNRILHINPNKKETLYH